MLFQIMQYFLIIILLSSVLLLGLKSERTTIHRNLCLSLLLAELLLVTGLDATENATLCGLIAGFLHYLFLATFGWMLGMFTNKMLLVTFFGHMNLQQKIIKEYRI